MSYRKENEEIREEGEGRWEREKIRGYAIFLGGYKCNP